jgi:hypothetical protein
VEEWGAQEVGPGVCNSSKISAGDCETELLFFIIERALSRVRLQIYSRFQIPVISDFYDGLYLLRLSVGGSRVSCF